MKEAAKEVMENRRPCRTVAREFSICHVSLGRFVKKLQSSASEDDVNVGYKRNRQVFSDAEERKLVDYLKEASAVYFGLSPRDVRKLALECAKEYGIAIPASWTAKQMAGADWFSAFLKRNADISVRCPEATSIARATSFNRTNVQAFFSKLAEVMDRHHFEGSDVWNMDETGVTTVQKPSKVVAARGARQVGAVTSSERGTLVTVAVAVNAIGNSIPAMFVFPRKNFYAHFIRDGPTGCIGTANKSGWMTEVDFTTFMKHFVKHSRCTVAKPVLLLLDNHGSHLSIEAIQIAKDNGVVLLSFPPHCSHRLQPLDRSVYGPFKRFISVAQDSWMRNNPAKPMVIYDLPALVAEALPKAVTPVNVTSGFKACRIYPFNREIFTDADYAPSSTTDRPEPRSLATQGTPPAAMGSTEGPPAATGSTEGPPAAMGSTGGTPAVMGSTGGTPLPSLSLDDFNLSTPLRPTSLRSLDSGPSPSTSFDPAQIRPHPKAAERKLGKTARRRRHSAILTDTPEKQALENDLKKKKVPKKDEGHKGSKKNASSGKGKEKCKQKVDKSRPPIKRKKAKTAYASSSSSDEDETYCLVCVEPYNAIRKKKESWIQCIECKNWSHFDCTDGKPTYIRHNCDSDSD